jgi:threonine synthase
MGIYGAYKGARELLGMRRIGALPRMLCVQQASCAPMVRAFEDGSDQIRPEHLVPRPTGIAEAILRGDPTRAYPHVRRIVLDSGGGFSAVDESEIRAARLAVEELEGVSPCFSAAAAVAGVIKLARRGALAPQSVIVINLTGADRAGAADANVIWLEQSADGWHAPAPALLPAARETLINC